MVSGYECGDIGVVCYYHVVTAEWPLRVVVLWPG